mmetsp:Transcript_51396/g.111571  ORF Transcript_51396/g.111571 Transcript_51396/m.111571 type:complete len:99 (+) Transcript_51396:1-297(+)
MHLHTKSTCAGEIDKLYVNSSVLATSASSSAPPCGTHASQKEACFTHITTLTGESFEWVKRSSGREDSLGCPSLAPFASPVPSSAAARRICSCPAVVR